MTSETSVVIQPIDKTTVNRICSGQVVLNLATAVKELLENSVDAKATSIQIRLKEYGSELIEVSDNGCGVEEINFQALTLKHYTSKISDFADVYSVETFGFRGEALSSLCALSDVTIITRHSSVPFGTKLCMDHNGIITEKVKTARQVGTTVILENIFSTLPVRHKEFLRNVKKEFTKMCGVLYAYGLQACGVSISCINQTSSRKIPVMETRGESVKSNIACIFGLKQSQNLFEIKEAKLNDDVLEEYNIKKESLKENQLDMFKLEGYISSCAHGCGRSSADRQFYYINSRPVDNPKISKLVNEVYHQYDPHQYPFVVLNIKVSLDSVDVNVTPDKRQIMLDNEKLLLALLKSTLKDLFQNVPATLNVQNAGLIKANPVEGKEGQGLLARLQKFRSNYAAGSDMVENKKNSVKNSQSSLDKFIKLDKRKEVSKTEPEVEVVTTENVTEVQIAPISDIEILEPKPIVEVLSPESITEIEAEPVTVAETKKNHTPNADEPTEPSVPAGNKSLNEESVTEAKKRKILTNENNSSETVEKSPKRKRIDIESSEKPIRKTVTISASIESIKRKILMKKNQAENSDRKDVKFFAEINPATNDSAEKELKKELTKPMFEKMEIIGQFNLGFIIAKLGPDIFIIDQHATDEKYNFETLQLNTVIQSQKLVIPQNLELTVEKEELLLQHADVIRKNGFDFTFDENAGPTKRVKLTSIPLSKNWIFGKSDIDELLFMLEDAPDSKICRPSRVRDMFASRACRKSVMIGTALNHSEMRRLIDHMGEIEQPWNCPHGRPTIRHLINLNMIYQQHE